MSWVNACRQLSDSVSSPPYNSSSNRDMLQNTVQSLTHHVGLPPSTSSPGLLALSPLFLKLVLLV